MSDTPSLPINSLQRFPFGRWLSITACWAALTGCEFHYSVDGGKGREKQKAQSTATTAAPGGDYIARVMTYNIQYLNMEAAGHGNRIEKLRHVITDTSPTVVGVQEVEDRDAMELVFPAADWHIIIDDDSPDRQDVAFAVRKPWKVNNLPSDLDADDEHFLAEGEALESFFPIRRDGLFVEISAPDGTGEMTVVNLHAKARVGGRANTDPRRAGASRELVKILQTELKGKNVVLLGDFNDSPDDASMNILETGNPEAAAARSTEPGTFMINLAEPLWDKNMVTQGANAKRLDRKTGLINIVYPESRDRNIRSHRRNVGTGPIMFDQILVTKNMEDAVVPDSVGIYHKPIALDGPGFSRTSDHLPMYADIRMLELK